MSLALALFKRLFDFSKLIQKLSNDEKDKVKVIVVRAFKELSAHLAQLGAGFLWDRDHEMYKALGYFSILHDEIHKSWCLKTREQFKLKARGDKLAVKNKITTLT